MLRSDRRRVVLVIAIGLAVCALIAAFVRVEFTSTVELVEAPLVMTAVDASTTVEELARVLDANPTLLTERDGNGDMLIHHAAYEGRPDVVALLLTRGADPNARGSFGKTPLHSAMPYRPDRITPRDLEVIRLLLAAGADPNRKSIIGTPTEHAQTEGHQKAVTLFLGKTRP